MLTKRIKYTDFNGKEQDIGVNFHCYKHDLATLEFSSEGGMQKELEHILNTGDKKGAFEFYKKLVALSYGEISSDGQRFIKTRPDGTPLIKLFMESPAYDALIIELSSNEKAAEEFILGVFPKDLMEEARKLQESQNAITPVK